MKKQAYEFFKGIGTITLYFWLTIFSAAIFRNSYYSSNIVIATLSQLGTNILTFTILAIIYHKRLIKDFKTFKKENIKIALKYWIMGFGIMVICNLIISMFVSGTSANESLNRKILLKYPISNIINMIFIGPLIEEITFRASFKNAFTKWYTFSITTGLLFGFAHIIAGLQTNSGIGEIIFILPYAALGFFLGKAFYETDNIYTSFIFHLVHNGFCVITIIAFSQLGGL